MNEGRIIVVGDFFPVPSNYSRFINSDLDYLFDGDIKRIFDAADYRICNLEGSLTDRPGLCEKTGPVLFAPTQTINAYKSIGFDCCTLANNHITDAGPEGVIDTIETLNSAGITHIGAGINDYSITRHLFFNVANHRVCLYNVAETMYNIPNHYRPGAFLYDEYIVCNELKLLKDACDYLIVVYHGGVEKFRYPSPQTQQRFHRMADSGADIILSQHTHCVGCEEYYKGSYFLYGQGNFLFRSFNNEYTDTGLIVEILIDEDSFSVRKHLVRAVDDYVRYDDKQDFSDFNLRSEKVIDSAFIQQMFDEYCLNELPLYLKAYKGKNLFYKVIGHYFPELNKKLLLRSYNRQQLLFTLHSLRSEQNQEVAINGIKVLLERKK